MAESLEQEQYERESSGGAFVIGLLTGAALGAGLGLLLAPKAGSELRASIGERARGLSDQAATQYKRASDTAGDWANKGHGFVDKARDAVSRGAAEVRHLAAAASGSSYNGSVSTALGDAPVSTDTADVGRS